MIRCIGCTLGHGGIVDVASDTCPRHGSSYVQAAAALSALGQQLAIAAALTRAFMCGYRFMAYEIGESVNPADCWAPGCRKEAP